ncbi:hypothetical protein G9A89_011962 [Geosiphon pyriformis]|nr:hypothetical protein G9A89_011962 [Geosiphon pyriformis]
MSKKHFSKKPRTVERYTKVAEKGNSSAQYNMKFAMKLVMEDGVIKDLEKVVEWFTKPADKGHLDAQNNPEICYKTGNGVAKDFVKSN